MYSQEELHLTFPKFPTNKQSGTYSKMNQHFHFCADDKYRFYGGNSLALRVVTFISSKFAAEIREIGRLVYFYCLYIGGHYLLKCMGMF